MAEIPIPEPNSDGSSLQTWIGLCVVILATFLGVANIKDDNIVQQMQLQQADRNDNWNWYQARKIRGALYEAFADELELARPNETPENKQAREARAAKFREKAAKQADEAKTQEENAKHAEKAYNALNAKDDQFDLCEAALAVAIALMGVTALIKRWWLFAVALVPAAFGIAMGIAGFLGIDTSWPAIDWIVKVLS